MHKFNLQLFSEGEASSAGESVAAPEASEASGEGADENISKEDKATHIENEKKSFSELIKGEYKNDRPTEIGAKGATAAKEQTKVSELTDKELEEIRRRVIMGERVTFS